MGDKPLNASEAAKISRLNEKRLSSAQAERSLLQARDDIALAVSKGVYRTSISPYPGPSPFEAMDQVAQVLRGEGYRLNRLLGATFEVRWGATPWQRFIASCKGLLSRFVRWVRDLLRD